VLRKFPKILSHRKQTRNHWARDDPAFVVLQVFFLIVVSIAYALAFHANVLKVIFWTVIVHYFALGLVIATTFWWVGNTQLRVTSFHGAVRQEIEWAFAWDVHCNGFVPVILIVYVFQFVLLPLLYDPGEPVYSYVKLAAGTPPSEATGSQAVSAVTGGGGGNLETTLGSSGVSDEAGQQLSRVVVGYMSPSFGSTLLANSLYAVSLLGYFYISSMGYAALPFLERTETLLYPCVLLLLGCVLCTALRVNLTSYFVWLVLAG